MEVSWNLDQITSHQVKIRVMCADLKGMLVAMSTAISAQEANIASASLKTTIDQKALCFFDVQIKDLEHLKRVKMALRGVKGVYQVTRMS